MTPSISSYLLYIFCANLLAYTTFYMAMKVVEGEKLTFQPIIYFILALAFWLPGLYYFVNSPVVGFYNTILLVILVILLVIIISCGCLILDTPHPSSVRLHCKLLIL